MKERTKEIPPRRKLQKILNKAIKTESTKNFKKILKDNNVEYFIRKDINENIIGIYFKYNNIFFKGSDLGRRYIYKNIITRFNQKTQEEELSAKINF
jgi:hypothetical protein